MKLKRKRRKVTDKQCPNLIGFAGKATVDSRLFPLRIDRRYKSTLEQTERERNAKISQRVKFIQQHENLTGLMSSLDQQNMDNYNTSLLKELEEKRMTLQRKLHRLEAELDCIPKNMKGPTTGITGHKAKIIQRNKLDATICKEHQNESWRGERKSSLLPKNIQSINSNSVLKERECEIPRKRNTWSGSYKSQIFVRKSKSQTQPISIDLFSSGRDLLQVLAEVLGEGINTYNVMFGTKQIDLDKSLFHQEIYHGTTVDLNLRLQGGMHRRKKTAKKTKKKKDNPKASEIHNTEYWWSGGQI